MTDSKIHIGIDPGLSGAIAFYDPRRLTLEVTDMPTWQAKNKQGKTKRGVDPYGLGRLLDKGPFAPECQATVEDVHAMPGQGVTSVFSFGFSAGVVHGVLGSLRIPMLRVPPAVWKKAMGLSSDKDMSRRRASEIFPSYAHLWARAKDDGRAEAALLAKYGSTRSD